MLRITWLSCFTSPMPTSNSFTARSPLVRQLAWAMLTPASLKVCEILASRPGLSPVMTRSETGRFTSAAFASQETSTRRSGSISSTLSQPTVCTVTPRPRVMKPTMASPGTGLQHLPQRTSTSSMPLMRTPPVGGRRATLRKSSVSRLPAEGSSSGGAASFSGGSSCARICWVFALP